MVPCRAREEEQRLAISQKAMAQYAAVRRGEPKTSGELSGFQRVLFGFQGAGVKFGCGIELGFLGLLGC